MSPKGRNSNTKNTDMKNTNQIKWWVQVCGLSNGKVMPLRWFKTEAEAERWVLLMNSLLPDEPEVFFAISDKKEDLQ